MVSLWSSGDGQVLAYMDRGPRDGYPVLVHHGMVASIRDFGLLAPLEDAGFRVITLARPGYGDSSPVRLETLAAWGRLVSRFSAALGIEAFSVLGFSSGAPYSYAVAAALPNKVRNVFVLSGTPDLTDPRVRALWPYPLDPSVTLEAFQALVPDLFFQGRLPQSDAEADSQRNFCFGIAQDLWIRMRDWGFRLEDLKVPVVIQHSEDDESVPFATAQITAAKIPRAEFHPVVRGGHFSLELADRFLREVVVTGLRTPTCS